jgi:hypothetical protein
MKECDHFWVQVSTTNDKERPRRCQCLRDECRRITKFSDADFNRLREEGKIKLTVSYPGIGTW